MKITAKLGLALAAIAVCATPALAQQGPGRMTPEQRAERFEASDTNKDGKLDKAEWLTAMPAQMKERMGEERIEQMWSMRLDSDGDGFVTKDEFVNMQMGRPG
ncbi:MAG: EF-hand domain-containing protein [Hyphomonadaceae bacterium]